MDGPRLDSRLLQIRALFTEIEIGLRFVRSAERLTHPALRAKVLEFAQHAYDTTLRLCPPAAPLSDDERDRLNRGLEALNDAIRACRERGK